MADAKQSNRRLMAKPRLDLAEAGMDAFNDRDMPRMLALLSEEVEVYASDEMVNAGRYTGHEGFASWVAAWIEAWEEVTAEVTDNAPVGERHVVTSVRQDGRGRGSGIEVSMDLAFVFDVNAEGRCTYLAMVPTAEEAFRIAEDRERS